MVEGSGLPPLGNSQTVLVLAICPCFKRIYFNLGTANGHLKTSQGREVAWLPIGRTAAVSERAVGSSLPGDGVEKSCSAAFRLRLLFCSCGVFGFGDVLLLVPWRTNRPAVSFERLLLRMCKIGDSGNSGNSGDRD